MFKLESVSKVLGTVTAVRNVSAHIRQGEIVAILGPSGSGKSTLLRCLNLLEKPNSGRVFVDGVDITAPGFNLGPVRQKIAMVFQHFNLFPHMTIADNIGYAPHYVLKQTKAAVDEKTDDLLKQVGLFDKKYAYPAQLSGGQKQRIAIVRALAMEPTAILFDEPTSALDPEMVKEVLDVMLSLANHKMTLVIVTHEMAFARKVADRIWFLDQGSLIEDSAPDDFFERPKTARAAQFLAQVL